MPEGHICCGSAGTYNMLRPDLAQQLQARKVEHIASVAPQIVAAGNIGCMEQIAARAEVPRSSTPSNCWIGRRVGQRPANV